jgi:hypothetical protein
MVLSSWTNTYKDNGGEINNVTRSRTLDSTESVNALHPNLHRTHLYKKKKSDFQSHNLCSCENLKAFVEVPTQYIFLLSDYFCDCI